MKIFCVGQNYAKHAREMKSEIPENPVFFMKPQTSFHPAETPFQYPDFTDDLHYELEVVFRFSKSGKNIEPSSALEYVNDLGLGIDFTARDLQKYQRERGLPWEVAKAFDHSAVVGTEWINLDQIRDIQNMNFHLELNDQSVQRANTSEMIFNVPVLISYISRYITVEAGDILFTGTPSGVGPVKPGDKLRGFLDDRMLIRLDIC